MQQVKATHGQLNSISSHGFLYRDNTPLLLPSPRLASSPPLPPAPIDHVRLQNPVPSYINYCTAIDPLL